MALAQGFAGRKRHGRSLRLSLSPGAMLALLAAVALHVALGWAWTHQGLTGAQAVSAQAPGQTLGDVQRDDRTSAVLLLRPAQRATHADQAAAHPDSFAERGRQAGLAGEGGELASPDAQAPTTANAHATGEGATTVASPLTLSGPQWLRGRYAPSESLDEGPRPQLGWFLDEDALAPLPFGSMVVQLWVSAEGHIDRAELLRADPPGDWALRALRPLPGTPMRPGLRAGQPVASTLVVELVSDNERLH